MNRLLIAILALTSSFLTGCCFFGNSVLVKNKLENLIEIQIHLSDTKPWYIFKPSFTTREELDNLYFDTTAQIAYWNLPSKTSSFIAYEDFSNSNVMRSSNKSDDPHFNLEQLYLISETDTLIIERGAFFDLVNFKTITKTVIKINKSKWKKLEREFVQ